MTASSLPRPYARASVFSLNDQNPLVPWLYMLPHALFFLVFVIYPVGYGVYISLHRWDPLNALQPYVGLEYYRNVFTPDTPQYDLFWPAFRNTLLFTAISTPLLILTALGLALLLFRPVFGRGVFRAIFFMPGILSVSVMGLLWRWLFDDRVGLLNVIRQDVFGGQPIPFLTTEGLAWVPIIVGTVWWTIGFNMTLYLAALSGISRSYYEAAEIDGAGAWAQFRFLTLPLLTPTTLFVAVTTVLGGLQLFGQSQVITGGGPTRSTESVIQFITAESMGGNYSSATALSFVFGLFMLIFTAFQFRLMTVDLNRSKRDS